MSDENEKTDGTAAAQRFLSWVGLLGLGLGAAALWSSEIEPKPKPWPYRHRLLSAGNAYESHAQRRRWRAATVSAGGRQRWQGRLLRWEVIDLVHYLRTERP